MVDTIEPLLPPAKPRREKNPGRLPVSNRAALIEILFVLETGLRWRDLPAEMRCGSGVTCWRRLRDRQAAGVRDRLHELLPAKLRAADQIDFSRAAVDSSSIRGLRGHPLQRPRVVYADRGYDAERHRRALRKRGIEPVIAERRTEHGSGLGKYRWVVERRHAWLHHFRRLRIRFKRRADMHGALLKLGCCLICWNALRRAEQAL
ncbi:transposase [Paraburkholderia sp. Se-20369]|nr:transposase [Paraburkholderia sp. Se-20369]